jgi:hypothetical protein
LNKEAASNTKPPQTFSGVGGIFFIKIDVAIVYLQRLSVDKG